MQPLLQSPSSSAILALALVTCLLSIQALRADEPQAVARQPVAHAHKKLLVIATDHFHQALHPFIERLGDAWAGAIAYYYDHQHLAKLVPNEDWYPPSIFFQGMKFMLFGDPTLVVPE